jgi:hypothetical protein
LTTLHRWQDTHKKKVSTAERWRRRHPIYYWSSSAASFSGAPGIAGAAENCWPLSGFVQVSPSNLRLLPKWQQIQLPACTHKIPLRVKMHRRIVHTFIILSRSNDTMLLCSSPNHTPTWNKNWVIQRITAAQYLLLRFDWLSLLQI